jgi:hypothetical protein
MFEHGNAGFSTFSTYTVRPVHTVYAVYAVRADHAVQTVHTDHAVYAGQIPRRLPAFAPSQPHRAWPDRALNYNNYLFRIIIDKEFVLCYHRTQEGSL